jgi:chromate reductase
MDKTVVLINASPRGSDWAQAQLIETLKMMTANVLTDASLLAPLPSTTLDAEGNIADAGATAMFRGCLDSLARQTTGSHA